MSSEAQFSVSLRIQGGNAGSINYQSSPVSFAADCSAQVAHGSTPGGVPVTAASGADIDLSKLTNPGGPCWMQNTGLFTIVIGIRDVSSSEFYPLDDIWPGECYVRRLSAYLGQEWTGTGSVSAASNNVLHAKAVGGDSYLTVNAFNQ